MVLLSSSGFVIQKHYCQDELKEIAIYVKAEACHTKVSDKPPCPFHPQEEQPDGVEKKNCCNNEVELVKLESEFQPETFELDFSKDEELTALQEEALITYQLSENTSPVHYLNFKPPLLVCDHIVRFQTFLC